MYARRITTLHAWRKGNGGFSGPSAPRRTRDVTLVPLGGCCMMNRREFLKAGTVTLLLIPVTRSLSGCGSSSPSTPGGTGCDGVSSTSTVVLAHSHTLCVPATDLTAPPAGGRTYNTGQSGAPSHFHMVT